MRSYISLLFTNSAIRDYSVAGVVLVVLALVGVQALTTLIDTTRQNVRVETARLEKKDEGLKNYTITRSVLDDTIATGSIKGRPIVLDPCTGQIKSK